MTDEQPPEEPERQARASRRGDARATASDLARMGIDPRSLGLDAPAPETRERRWVDDPGTRPELDPEPPVPGGPDDNVVALRPNAAPAPQTRSPGPPAPREASVEPPGWHRPAEQVVASTVTPLERSRNGSGMAPTVRSAARGLVTLEGAAVAEAERDLVARVRQRQSARPVVAFLAAQGGVGTTTVAAGVGAVLAALRDDRSVLLDVQAGTPPLSSLYGVSDPHSVRRILASPDAALPSAASNGLGVVDGPSWDQPLERADLNGLVERLAAEHAFMLVDAGDDPTDGAYAAVARADRAVVVTGPGEIGLRAVEVALRRLDRVNPAAARSAVVVVVCRDPGPTADEARRAAATSALGDGAVVVVGHDEALAGGRPFRADQVSVATRMTLLHVAASLADGR